MRNANVANGVDLDSALEDFAAELTELAYPIVLRNAAVDNWLDLELELWQDLRKTVRKWARDWPSEGVILVPPIQQDLP